MINGVIKNKIVFLIIVAERRQKEAIVEEILEKGTRCVNLTYGRPYIEPNYLLEATGFTPDENKLIITGLLLNEKADEICEILTQKFKFGTSDHGFAFTVPIERLSF